MKRKRQLKPTEPCECAYCKNKLQFELPKEIIDEAIKGNLVLFVGAGVSTESKLVFKQTLYEEVLMDLKLNSKTTLDFPEVMSRYCQQKNGRKLFLEKIHKRFDYCHQYPELYQDATRFHKEVSSIYSINTILTTNWDDYFERECNAIPIITPEDFAFYNIEARKVFKLHGSISNYGSIIATKDDYDRGYKKLQKGLVGSNLKMLLATKTILFVGFSFKDYDFNRIYSYLKKEMRDVLPHCYIVSLDKSFEDIPDKEKVTFIKTDGTFFISTLRKHLEGCNFLIPKKNLQKVFELKYLCSKAHKLSTKYFFKHKSVSAIYNLLYQDGLDHAFDFLIYHAKSGRSFNPEERIRFIKSYDKMKVQLLKHKNYPDYVYVEGYVTGLFSILLDDDFKMLPLFFIMGKGPLFDEYQFKKYLDQKIHYHKIAQQMGEKYFAGYLFKDADVVPQHRAFIGS